MPFQTENTTTWGSYLDEKENSTFKAGGEPLGLLLTLTFAADTGYTKQTENSTTYAMQTENTTSYA